MIDCESYGDGTPFDADFVASIEGVRPDIDGMDEEPDESIDGADLLDRAMAFVARFVSLPSEEAAIAVVLWAGHTHLMDAIDSTPRLAFLSAEPGSGKSRALEITALLAPLALEAASATTASLVRAMDDPEGTPTFFIDEIDTKFGPKAKGDEELRAMLNMGHRRGGSFLRCELQNDQWVPVRKDAYAAVAMAGIGSLPDTILTRSVVVRMRKRAPEELVEPYRQRDHRRLGHALRDELAAWADLVRDAAANCRPVMPDGIVDRKADVWEPLIVVADMAGGRWPAMAREAALQMLAVNDLDEEPGLGVQLLRDIQRCFGSEPKLSSKELLRRLQLDAEAPWGEYFGRSPSERALAELLRPYGVKSASIRQSDGSTPKGYKRESFVDPWRRYLRYVTDAATDATSATDPDSSHA